MKNDKHPADTESSLALEAPRIERVERFRMRKVKTIEDLLERLGYEGHACQPDGPQTAKAARGRRSLRLGRIWAWRAASGKRSSTSNPRGLAWH